MPIANKLKADNVTIITFGIQSGNFAELHQLSSEPGHEHSFLLDSFSQFESLARKALHTGTVFLLLANNHNNITKFNRKKLLPFFMIIMAIYFSQLIVFLSCSSSFFFCCLTRLQNRKCSPY